MNMARHFSPEAASRANKRKGTRSVSSLTPQQLERKRANDREAQRAIRLRTKEHIERLEREVSDLRRAQGSVQDLVAKNQRLEAELATLRKSLGMGTAASSHVYDHYTVAGGHYSSPRSSPFPSEGDNLQDFSSHAFVPPTTENMTEPGWVSTLTASVPSNASSPTSTNGPDEYGSGYTPTSMPSSMLSSMHTSSRSMGLGDKHIKTERNDPRTDHGLHMHNLINVQAPYVASAWVFNPNTY